MIKKIFQMKESESLEDDPDSSEDSNWSVEDLHKQ